MKVVVLQSNYLPWKGYFDLINDADTFVFYDVAQYTKNDWRNRNKIYCRNGLQWLTIPVKKSAAHQSIDKVFLGNSIWQKKHYKSIQSCYGQAEYYHDIAPLLEQFYLDSKWNYLSKLNQYLIEILSEKLGITTQFINASDLQLKHGRIDRLIDILCQIQATEYISGPAAKDYLIKYEAIFSEHGIKLTYKDYPVYPGYSQFDLPHEHRVSIVDLIAHVGFHAAPDYIWGMQVV